MANKKKLLLGLGILVFVAWGVHSVMSDAARVEQQKRATQVEALKQRRAEKAGAELSATKTGTAEPGGRRSHKRKTTAEEAAPEANRVEPVPSVRGSGGGEQATAPQAPEPKAVLKGPIVCDRFELSANLGGDSLQLSLDTDLPDATDLMVSVDRTYVQQEDGQTYSREYFSEKTTVGKWRDARKVTVDDAQWAQEVDRLRSLFASTGDPITLQSVSDTIDVRFVVPVNQAEPAFGDMNANLHGKMVKEAGLRIVEVEKRIRRPLGQSRSLDSDWVSPDDLQVGSSYRLPVRGPDAPKSGLAQGTPLMPTFDCGGDLSLIEQVVYLPEGSTVTVRGRRFHGGTLWYQVQSVSTQAAGQGSGWVNSMAFHGRALEKVR